MTQAKGCVLQAKKEKKSGRDVEKEEAWGRTRETHMWIDSFSESSRFQASAASES